MSPTQNLLLDTPTHALVRPATRRPVAAAPGGRHRMAGGRRGRPGGRLAVSGFLLGLGFVGVVLLGVLLLAAFQTLVRRRPLRSLLARDTAWFAHGWAGKVLVAAVLLAIPAAMVLSRWPAAGTAGTPTTAGRRCSCSSSWPGPTSSRVALS